MNYLEKIQRMQALCKNIEEVEIRIMDAEQAKIDKLRYEEELAEYAEEFIIGAF